MAFRVFSDVSNLPTSFTAAAEGKRMTRAASRKVLSDISTRNIPQKSVLACVGKENVVDNLCKVQVKPRQTEEVVSRIPADVKDIDAEDTSNPQLCTEYALEIYAYMKELEKRGSVRSDHLSGCSLSDKMRSVLVDWLVEVQMLFKLLQETLVLTINTIDRSVPVPGFVVAILCFIDSWL